VNPHDKIQTEHAFLITWWFLNTCWNCLSQTTVATLMITMFLSERHLPRWCLRHIYVQEYVTYANIIHPIRDDGEMNGDQMKDGWS